MQTSSRFTMAVHTMILVYLIGGDRKLTSDAIAISTKANPVVERRIIASLKKAGIVEVYPGKGGTKALKAPEDVSLWDIYRAAENDNEDIFVYHDISKSNCPVSKNLHGVLDTHLENAQNAMKNSLSEVTMKNICDDITGPGKVDIELIIEKMFQ